QHISDDDPLHVADGEIEAPSDVGKGDVDGEVEPYQGGAEPDRHWPQRGADHGRAEWRGRGGGGLLFVFYSRAEGGVRGKRRRDEGGQMTAHTLEHRTLGTNGPSVSAIGLGLMSLSGVYGESDDAAAVEFIHYAIERGVDFLDSADLYGWGHNEELLRRAL